MRDLLLRTLLSFLTVALTAATVQNIALVKGFGLSRLIRMPRSFSELRQMGLMIFLALEISSLIEFIANYYLFNDPLPAQWRGVAVAVYSVAAYFIMFALSKIMLLPREAVKTVEMLPSVCFSYAVMGTLAIEQTSTFTLIQCLGYGAGAAAGYMGAIVLAVEGLRISNSEQVPKVLRGMPAMLIYMSGLVLAVFALSRSV